MSSKNKITTSEAEAKPSLVPKLRFPELREKEGWEPATLGEKSSILKGKGISKADLDPNGSQICIRYGELYTRYGETIREVFSRTKVPASELFLSKPDDVIIPSSGETKVDIAKASCVLAGGIALGGDLNVIRSNLNGTFLSYYLNGPKRLDIAKVAQGDTVVHLYPYQLEALHIAVPTPAEQQKVADCLSSVDELIAAQARKMEALKTHKNGLMQQLFPHEGETQPRLRFPEFRRAEKWDVRKVGDMFNLVNGCAFKPEDWKSSGTPIIRIQNLNDPSAEFNFSQAPVPERNRIKAGDLLFAWSGTLGSSFGARIWSGPSGVLNQHIFKVLMDERQITLPFSLLVLSRVEGEIAKKTHGFKASFVHVKKSDLVRIELLLPSLPEQKRIASCLTSLDTLITQETQKLEALKTHKNGLMQQLFPSPEVVEA